MRVLMRQTRLGSESSDPGLVKMFRAGESYDMEDALAEVFLKEGSAERTKQLTGPSETKDEPKAAPRARGKRR